MLGDGFNDVPSLKKADTGIAVQGATEAARQAADIIFLAPGMNALLAAIQTSRRIFSRMRSYVVYRIALSLHLEIFFTILFIVAPLSIQSEAMPLERVVFIALFSDIATLAIAYDRARFDTHPVAWNLKELWILSVLLGIALAAFSWAVLATLWISAFEAPISVIFLQIVLSQNWLIFITRSPMCSKRLASAPGIPNCASPSNSKVYSSSSWDAWPSWPLVLAVLGVDILSTIFVIFGWFDSPSTNTVSKHSMVVICVEIYIYSALVMVPLFLIFYFVHIELCK